MTSPVLRRRQGNVMSRAVLSWLCGAFIGISAAHAGDWPQVLGPARNGIASDEHLLTAWPEDGPRTLWHRPVGDGFSGVAVAQSRAIVFHRIRDEEVVEALDAVTGQSHWKVSFPTRYSPAFTSDGGPRAVPLLHEGRVFLFGARGQLVCLNLADGKLVWQRDTYEDFSSRRPFKGEPPEGYFGCGSTPLIEGDRLVLNVGGESKDAGVVAFDIATGRTVWQATRERASYSSPVAATIGGRRHIVMATRLQLLSLDPKDGRVLFQQPFGKLGPSVTAASPVVMGDQIFITGSYGFGAMLLKVGPTGAMPLWEDDELLSSQYTTSIVHDGLLYGVHGREDIGVAELRCVDPKLKQVVWQAREFGYATLILADSQLLIMKTDGQLVMASPDRRGFKELGRTRLFAGTTRALPALSNGLLYVRDDSTLKCVDLRPAR